jgi:3-oxoacyl-[acyl-carrier protein] reductase
MTQKEWSSVVDVNLKAILDVDTALLEQNLIADEARLVYLSSISGIAGNFGQTNYAYTKAALIGYVEALSPQLADRGITANAVAPGFIETDMTASLPILVREAGRRLNALSQGGKPEDVAEAIQFLASPASSGISGQTLRVCGGSLLGA